MLIGSPACNSADDIPMSREVPYYPELVCDHCGTVGAFDFMGDYLCHECACEAICDNEEEYREEG